MSAKPIMMTGVLYPLNKMMPPVPCAFVGNAWDPSLEVGGGPMPGGPPLDIWGGPYFPPGIWGPTDPRPTPPIVIPRPPTEPPTDPGTPKPPPPEGGWGWHPEYGWGYFPGGGGKPIPIHPSTGGPTPKR